jgi:hypothetical protein
MIKLTVFIFKKPVKLRKNVQPEEKPYKVNDSLKYTEPIEKYADDDRVYYNPDDQNDVPLN